MRDRDSDCDKEQQHARHQVYRLLPDPNQKMQVDHEVNKEEQAEAIKVC